MTEPLDRHAPAPPRTRRDWDLLYELASLACCWLGGLCFLPLLWFLPWVVLSYLDVRPGFGAQPGAQPAPLPVSDALLAGAPCGVAALAFVALGVGFGFYVAARGPAQEEAGEDGSEELPTPYQGA